MIPTTADRHRLVARIDQDGLGCTVCDAPAGPSETDEHIDHVLTDPEPAPFMCWVCIMADGGGA